MRYLRRMLFPERGAISGLKSGKWRKTPIPEACKNIPTMLMPDELRLLRYLTEAYFSNQGLIVDAGCFLGGSTLALAEGLRNNLSRTHSPETKLIHSFDLFRIEEWSREIYFPGGGIAGDSIRHLFDKNIAHHTSLVNIHEGDITHEVWGKAPIEILFIDVAKHWTVCDWITENFFPHLIPGRSIVVQQDYLYHHWNAWLHITMEYYSDNFEILCHTEQNSVAFFYKKTIEPQLIRPKLVESLSLGEKIELMDKAANRFSAQPKELLKQAKAHFIEMLRHET